MLGYRRDDRRQLVLLRTLSGAMTTIGVMRGTIEIAVRYTDPYDIDRSSPWVTIHTTSPTSPSKDRS